MNWIFIPIVVAGLAVFVFLFYLYSICPGRKTERESLMQPFMDKYVAHRGLFNHTNRPENSMTAFRRALHEQYAIELDVQLTRDGKLVVFHDENLKRMCGVNKYVGECDYEELKEFSLEGTDEKIPLMEQVTALIDGKVPIVVEIKSHDRVFLTTRALADIMAEYEGVYCVQSFHPLALWWYRRYVPQIPRGQLSTDYRKNKIKTNALIGFFLSNLMLNFISKPDFISYNLKYVNQPSFRLCRRLYHPVCAAWTVRSERQLQKAKKHFQIFIFDGFMPERKIEKNEG